MTRSGVPQEKIIDKLNMNEWENFDNKLEINSTVADKRGVSTNKQIFKGLKHSESTREKNESDEDDFFAQLDLKQQDSAPRMTV